MTGEGTVNGPGTPGATQSDSPRKLVEHVDRFGGRRVHWVETSDGPAHGPTVVLMAGCGLALQFWREVVRGLPERRIVAYDRPGLGGTRWPGHLPTLDAELATLRDLVRHDARGPVVLVAHSMAGFHAEALAREYPELVAGIVFIDASVEPEQKRPRLMSALPAHGVAHAVRDLRLGSFGSFAWRFGSWTQSQRDYRRFGEGRLPAVYRDADSLAMATAESTAYGEQAYDLLSIRRGHDYPDIPAVVLTASGGEGRWNPDRQVQFAELLHARHELVNGSKHLMMVDRPDAICAAVREVSEGVVRAPSD